MPDRRCAVQGGLQEFVAGDLSGGIAAARLPDDGARAHQLAVVPAVQHRPARQHDGRNVDGGRRHNRRRRGLVAARRQHDPVERVTVQQLDQAQIGQVAVQAGGRTLAVLEQGVAGKFYRDAARVADAVAHPARQVQVMAVARVQVAARLRDPDDGPTRPQFFGRGAEVHEPLQVQGGHVGMIGIVEPVLRAQAAGRGGGHLSAFPGQLAGILAVFVIGLSMHPPTDRGWHSGAAVLVWLSDNITAWRKGASPWIGQCRTD